MKAPNQKTALVRWIFRAFLWSLLAGPSLADSAKVSLVRAPDGGIQPQAAVDAKGIVHLIYFNGKAQGGDLFYVRRESRQETFSAPIRVNRRAASAIAMGTIRGAHLAVDADRR